MINRLPKGFCSKCASTHKTQGALRERTDYSTPFQFSQEVMEGKKKVVVTLPKKGK